MGDTRMKSACKSLNVPMTPLSSVTVTTKLYAPGLVGVPVISPLDRPSVSPGGSDPPDTA